MKLINLLLHSIALAGAVACNQAKPPDFHSQKIVYPNLSKDAVLNVPRSDNMKIRPVSGLLPSADFFELQRILIESGSTKGLAKRAARAQRAILDFYKSPLTRSSVRFEESPYAQFFIAKAEPEFRKATANLAQFFNQQKSMVGDVIDATSANFAFPSKSLTTRQALGEIANFFSAFEGRLRQSNVHDGIKRAVLTKLYEKFWFKAADVNAVAEELDHAPDVATGATVLRRLLGELGVELDPGQGARLQSAADLGSKINQAQDEKAIFSLLTEIWDSMDAAERTRTFGGVSQELYDFLESKHRGSSVCFKVEECSNLIFAFKRNFFVLPGIRSYGVDRLQKQIQTSAVATLKETTNRMATDLVKSAPEQLRQAIDSEMDNQLTRFVSYRENFGSFARAQLQRWFTKQYTGQTLPALERSEINSAWIGSESSQSMAPTDTFATSGTTLGTAMAATSALFFQAVSAPKADSASIRQLAIVRVNQILAHGGFSLNDGGAFPSLRRRSDETAKPRTLNIEVSLSPGEMFTFSSATVKDGFDVITESTTNLNIRGEARLLMGFAAQLPLFQDWSPNPMNRWLGEIRASHLLSEVEDDSLNRPAFPTDALLALSLGNASAILGNLQAKGSPAFILCPDDSPLWLDRDGKCNHPSTLVGLVNIDHGKRAERAELLGQAEFLDALITFLQNADRLRETKSKYLLQRDASGRSGLEQFSDSQPKLRSLALGLTNFITSRLQNEDGQFYDAYILTSHQVEPGRPSLRTRLKAIKALAKSAQYFNFNGYVNSALAGYYALNRETWDDKIGFYRVEKSEAPSTFDLALAIDSLSPLLQFKQDINSADQLRRLLAAWNGALH